MKRILSMMLLAVLMLSCGGRPKISALYTFDLAGIPLLEKTGLFKPDSAEQELSLPVAGVPWQSARFLVADVVHDNPQSAILWIHFYGLDTQKARISAKVGILPHLPTRVVLPLEYLDGQTFFMARRPRQLKGTMPGHRLPQEQIAKVTITLEPVSGDCRAAVRFRGLYLTAEEPAPLPAHRPIVDAFGQWTEREWPGKVKDEAELVQRLKELRQAPEAALPNDWSAYGGWKGKRFPATGFFYAKQADGRWWLVDPEGYAFFSVGMDCVNPNAAGPVSGMTDLFSWLPTADGPFAAALSRRGESEAVNFMAANLIRAFGAEWETEWRAVTRNLLRRCRFNTIGNWSDLKMIKSARLPYVWPLRRFPTTKVLLYRDFPDVFSQEYRDAARQFAQQILEFKDDPYMIGYFLANEPLWAFGENNIASEMLATNAESETRRVLVDWLKKRYGGDAVRFSAAWNRSFASFEELLSTAVLDAAELSPAAETDLWDFSRLMVDEYLKQPCEALRALDPNHLNLGIRYAWISSELCYVGGKYFDVFSINSYTERPDPETVAEIAHRSGRPVMIGEFHHGAVDRGLPSTGIRGVVSQEERGVAYRYYVEQGAALPDLVGVHYFQLNDQPILGRFDGENYNIGLVDICNQPYPEMVEATSRTNEAIYEVVSDKRKPTEQSPRLMPAIFF